MALQYPSGRQVGYRYDADGRLVALKVEGATEGPVKQAFLPRTIAYSSPSQSGHRPRGADNQAQGWLMAVAETAPPLEATFELDADGRLLREVLPGGASRSYRYTAGRLSAFSQTLPGTEPATRTTSFERDLLGRVTSETTAGVTTRNSYDAAGQLLAATGGPAGTLEFQYDPTGNRIAMTAAGVTTR